MKRFKVVNDSMDMFDKYGKRVATEMYITLHHPPYEDEDVLSRIKWQAKDVTITEIKQEIEE